MNTAIFFRKAKKALPFVLSALSVVGVAATAILSAKATVKAVYISAELYDEENQREATPKETFHAVWKYYIPTTAVAVLTAACIVSNGVLNKRQQEALIAAYTLAQNAYKQYRAKNIEINGSDADRAVRKALAVENAKVVPLIHPVLARNLTLDWGVDDCEVRHLFYEAYGERYFESTINRVLQAEMTLNRNFYLGGFVSVNDFYEYLGLEPFTGGDEIGWCVCDGYDCIDFDHHREVFDEAPDGTHYEALVIDIDILPGTPEHLYWL